MKAGLRCIVLLRIEPSIFFKLCPKVDVNKANDEGWTPLHYAASYGTPEILQIMLENPKIDVNKADNEGSTPLHCVAQDRPPEILQIMLENPKIDVNKADNEG
eukprot:598602_1